MGFLEMWSNMKSLKKFVVGIYLLQFIALFTGGISLLVAGFLAYLKYDESLGQMEESHLKWQIKTFWVTLGALVVGTILLVIYIGKIILLLTPLWLFYRVMKGAYLFSQGLEIEDKLF